MPTSQAPSTASTQSVLGLNQPTTFPSQYPLLFHQYQHALLVNRLLQDQNGRQKDDVRQSPPNADKKESSSSDKTSTNPSEASQKEPQQGSPGSLQVQLTGDQISVAAEEEITTEECHNSNKAAIDNLIDGRYECQMIPRRGRLRKNTG